MKPQKFTRTIDDDNAPERLRGLVMLAVLTETRLEFQVDLPNELTNQEIAYLRWFTGEIVDEMKTKLPPDTFGEARYGNKIHRSDEQQPELG